VRVFNRLTTKHFNDVTSQVSDLGYCAAENPSRACEGADPEV